MSFRSNEKDIERMVVVLVSSSSQTSNKENQRIRIKTHIPSVLGGH